MSDKYIEIHHITDSQEKLIGYMVVLGTGEQKETISAQNGRELDLIIGGWLAGIGTERGKK